jgi:hypothetical protein
MQVALACGGFSVVSKILSEELSELVEVMFTLILP